MFKKFLIFCCFFGNVLFSIEKTLDLSFYKESEHFKIYCLKQDFSAAESVLKDLEQYWIKWDQNLFSINFSEKIKLNIFPDIQSYNLKIFNRNTYPDWSVCQYKDNSISIVSPQNPGPMHSEESIMKSGRLCLGWYFTHQKFNDFYPLWLALGLSYNEVKIYSKKLIYQHLLNKNNEIEIPLLSQLEEEKELDRSGLIACYILTEFLVDQWGFDKALALLNDYSSFEKILGISKKEFRVQCARYY